MVKEEYPLKQGLKLDKIKKYNAADNRLKKSIH